MACGFFPDLAFGWFFYGSLVALTLLASYTDLRWLVVPKSITLTGMALGLVMNAVRGGWLGSDGNVVWTLEGGFAGVGAIDGLLFGLAGLLTAFLLFLGLWLLGACGGGDVKLFAAVGAWVGPTHSVFLLVGSTFLMVAFALLAVMLPKKPAGRDPVTGEKRVSRLSAYALPLAIATAIMMLWFYRFELQLMERTTGPNELLRRTENAPARR